MAETPLSVGLRIDVDTFRGTRDGVPTLLALLQKHAVAASFFFSVGPDNMGRHLWRLLRPAFLLKMLRSNAASLYGWDILLRGVFWPGPNIGKRLAGVIRKARDAGHEIGLHAWDHHRWQQQAGRMSEAALAAEIGKGHAALREILGQAPVCSAAAGWRANAAVIRQKQAFGFAYNSDCRGHSLFVPLVDGERYAPQVPVTLPTYDEVIGRNGISNANYNDYLLSQIRPGQLNVLTIHAEVEGIVCAALFDDFLTRARQQGIRFVPLGALLPDDLSRLPAAPVETGPLPGREGWVCWQGQP